MKRSCLKYSIIAVLLMVNITLVNVSGNVISSDSYYKHLETEEFESFKMPDDYWNSPAPENPEPGKEETIINAPGGGNCALIITEGIDIGFVTFIGSRIQAKETLSIKNFNIKCLTGPNKEQIETLVLNWIPNNIGDDSHLFVYFIGHGGIDDSDGIYKVALRRNYVANTTLLMKISWLAGLLNQIDNHYSISTVLIESCYSGNAISDLSAEKRIVMTSTSKTLPAYFLPWWMGEPGIEDSGAFFSRAFFDAFVEKNKNGKLEADENEDGKVSIGEAWMYADWEAVFAIPNDPDAQNPKIDDNGNKKGVGTTCERGDELPMYDEENRKDGLLALETYFDEQDTESEFKRENRVTDLKDIIQKIFKNIYSNKILNFFLF